MKIIPYEAFQIDSSLSVAEIMQRIGQCTEKKKWFNFYFSFNFSKEFSGDVNEHEFKIEKNTYYVNHFKPIIEGRVEETSTGARVTISMRLNLWAKYFMLIWLSGVSAFGLVFLIQFSLLVLVPIGMLVFGVALVSGGFWYDASKQKVMLIELMSKN